LYDNQPEVNMKGLSFSGPTITLNARLLTGPRDAMMSTMRPIHFVVVMTVFVGLPGVRADGCKFAFTGQIVPEREQRAMIEWADGSETLYVATRSDPTADGTVWVVPVRATAAQVRAEPV